MDARFSELMGMHAGDGTIYRTNTGLVWELRGGLDEQEFYQSYVSSLVRQCGLHRFRVGSRGKAYGVRSCNRPFIEHILEAGFPIGKKSRTLRTPRGILSADSGIQAAFLRGLIATDGTTYLTRTNTECHAHYPIIECSSISQQLLLEVNRMLSDLSITSYVWNSKHTSSRNPNPLWTLRIAGHQRTQRFIKTVGLSNPKMTLHTPDNL